MVYPARLLVPVLAFDSGGMRHGDDLELSLACLELLPDHDRWIAIRFFQGLSFWVAIAVLPAYATLFLDCVNESVKHLAGADFLIFRVALKVVHAIDEDNDLCFVR